VRRGAAFFAYLHTPLLINMNVITLGKKGLNGNIGFFTRKLNDFLFQGVYDINTPKNINKPRNIQTQ
jgi:hypothetical protein